MRLKAGADQGRPCLACGNDIGKRNPHFVNFN